MQWLVTVMDMTPDLFIICSSLSCAKFKIHYVSIRNSKWCALFGIYIYIYQQSIYQQSIYYIYIMSDIIYILSGENATIGFEPCTHDQIFPWQPSFICSCIQHKLHDKFLLDNDPCSKDLHCRRQFDVK